MFEVGRHTTLVFHVLLNVTFQVKGARSGCVRQQEINRQLALANNDKEPQFTEAKEELRRLVTEANDLKTEYDRDYDELSEYELKTP